MRKETQAKKGVCDVCRLVDGDTSIKEVYYCPICKKWICLKCADKWDRRTMAAVLNGMMSIGEFLKLKKKK